MTVILRNDLCAECDEPSMTRGLCQRHYGSHYSRDRLGLLAGKYDGALRCRWPDCEETGRAFCRRHYSMYVSASKRPRGLTVREGSKRLRTTELTEPIEGSRKPLGEGYVSVWQGGKWMPEHRVVMEQVLGRPLRKGESVHHRNGIRNDNSPENLELWVGPIRYGQRADDITCPHCGGAYSSF